MVDKLALIIGNSRYEDAGLSRLTAPDIDVRTFAAVLRDPQVGQFNEVVELLNEPSFFVRKTMARFFTQRKRDDLLLLYFSGHGVRDEQGHLYLALKDTERSLLTGTAIEAAFITAQMDRSNSKRQVLMLDCCHSGAFSYGAKAALGASVGTAAAFEGTGYGRVVLTATDSTQYAWEGDQVIGEAENSLFTHFLIQGLKTGEADLDANGTITIDELYDYVYERVVNETPKQTPGRSVYRGQGEIIIAQNARLTVGPSPLPSDLREALESTFFGARLAAVPELEKMLCGRHAGLAVAAREALNRLATDDDSRQVSKAATKVLAENPPKVLGPETPIQPDTARDRLAVEEQRRRDALETVEEARRLFDAGDHDEALRILRDFAPPHELVSGAFRALRRQEHRESLAAAIQLWTGWVGAQVSGLGKATTTGFQLLLKNRMRLGLAGLVIGGILYLTTQPPAPSVVPSRPSASTAPPVADPPIAGLRPKPSGSTVIPPAVTPSALPSSTLSEQLSAVQQRAQQQLAGGDRRALETVSSGLTLDAHHAGLQKLLAEIWTGAEAAAGRARRDAMQIAPQSSAAYKDAEKRLANGVRLRNLAKSASESWSRGAEAARAFWAAQDLYVKAAREEEQDVREQAELQQKVTALVRAASEAASHQTAMETLREALRLDPANEKVRQLLEQREAAVAKEAGEERRRQIAAAIRQIEGQLAAGELDRAERALIGAEQNFQATADLRPLRERLAELGSAGQLAREEQSIRQALREYEAAYESLDAAAVLRVQPSFTREQANQLAKAFSEYRSYNLTIENVQISLQGPRATASTQVTRGFTPKVGRRQSVTGATVFLLEKRGTVWQIVGVQ